MKPQTSRSPMTRQPGRAQTSNQRYGLYIQVRHNMQLLIIGQQDGFCLQGCCRNQRIRQLQPKLPTKQNSPIPNFIRERIPDDLVQKAAHNLLVIR